MRWPLAGLVLVACGNPATTQHHDQSRSPPVIAVEEPKPEPAEAPPSSPIVAAGKLPELTLERTPPTFNVNRAYVQAEVEALQKLMDHTPRTSHDYWALAERLARGYAEWFLMLALNPNPANDPQALAKKSVEYFGVAVEKKPRNAEMAYYFALMSERIGDLSSARAAYRAVPTADRASDALIARAHYALALITDLGEPSAAVAEYLAAHAALERLPARSDRDVALAERIRARVTAIDPTRGEKLKKL